jgi:hypothetical protein
MQQGLIEKKLTNDGHFLSIPVTGASTGRPSNAKVPAGRQHDMLNREA